MLYVGHRGARFGRIGGRVRLQHLGVKATPVQVRNVHILARNFRQRATIGIEDERPGARGLIGASGRVPQSLVVRPIIHLLQNIYFDFKIWKLHLQININGVVYKIV